MASLRVRQAPSHHAPQQTVLRGTPGTGASWCLRLCCLLSGKPGPDTRGKRAERAAGGGCPHAQSSSCLLLQLEPLGWPQCHPTQLWLKDATPSLLPGAECPQNSSARALRIHSHSHTSCCREPESAKEGFQGTVQAQNLHHSERSRDGGEGQATVCTKVINEASC